MQTTFKEKEAAPQIPQNNIRKEFEEFAYIVSHDLNTPLRHLKQFIGLLVKHDQKELTTEEKKYVYYIQKSLERLDDMQIALLAYSRINTSVQTLRRIHTEELIQGALNVLSPHIAELNPSIIYQDLPIITVDPSQMQMVFYYLLSNALKFHRPDTQRKIWISCTEYEDKIIFEVRDNGIGIPNGYYEEIFKMFRKLHTAEEYNGIGAGLTLAKKIIERHDGKMWIESRPNNGTSVLFSLPANK